jgi:transposase-like protein
MKDTTKNYLLHVAQARLYFLVVLSCLALALLGQMPQSSAGWLTCPPQVATASVASATRRWAGGHGGPEGSGHSHNDERWLWVYRSRYIPLLRSLALWGLWLLNGQQGPAWVRFLPWLLWLWQMGGVFWPWLRRQPEWRLTCWLLWQGQRLALVIYLGLFLGAALRRTLDSMICAWSPETGWSHTLLPVGSGCVICGREEPWLRIERQEDGSYKFELCGHFSGQIAGDAPFRLRLVIIFLLLLTVPGRSRGGARTRDGWTSFVSQRQLAEWLHIPQPDISRWMKYWLQADWADLLSLKTVEVLTVEVRERIVEVFAAFPQWGVEQVHSYLHEQGLKVSARQVRQAAEDSGWSKLRQELLKRWQLTTERFLARDDWQVGELLSTVQALLERLEAAGAVTPEVQLAVSDLQTLAAEVGVEAKPPPKALPWMMRVEQVLFGAWQEVDDGQVRCIYCGSAQVVRKSKKPRLKKYYDEQGQLQMVEVYRYYCRNKECAKGSFTNLPPGLVPYSPYRTQVKVLAVQMYAWGYSTYRRTGQALGVTSITAYRWVSAWGYELLPVAALFGVLKSSGVVGVDEKYVLVPKNDKPAGKMRRWMYVYFAVDVYTYDLLHIAIYPHNEEESALAFLLALRAKGYQPRVIVTDLRRDYGSVVAQVFPQAVHHECIFHALQNVQDYCKEVYGAGYAETHPEAEELKRAVYHIFAAKTKRTAQKRYDEVLALRQGYVQETPAAAVIFDFLERHWPKLVNGIESELIPTTNNTVELVIRRFDQHYQNFCGFESIETTQFFLGVFEKVYRFTPFSDDAQPRIRGKCPLELAGYDISQMPMATICEGFSVDWPLKVAQNHVPNR